MKFSELYNMQKGLQERAERFPSDSFRISYTEEPKPKPKPEGGDTNGAFTEETLLARFTEKGKGEIIRNGTAREKAALRLADFEAGQILGLREILTDAEAEELIKRAKARRDYEDYLYYLSEFETLTQYEKELRSLYSTTQTELAELVMLVNEWDDMETEAFILTLVTRIDKDWRGKTAEEKKAFMRDILQVYPKDFTADASEKLRVVINREGADYRFYFDEIEESINVEIAGEGGLYGKIIRKAERVRGFLSTLKAAVNAAADYIDRNGGDDLLIPFGVESILREVWGESYLQSIVREKSHLRSTIIRCHSEGTEINEEEVRAAVIPDYYETEESAEARKIFNRAIARFAGKIKGTE